MAGIAQGAVDSLLGRLTGLLIDEAQLLGGLRGDVEFIRDEMESMNSLLLHLTEAQHRAHHVRTWMKQVVGLARDCEAYVELYIQHAGAPAAGKGLLGYLHGFIRLLRTVPARHRIRELKVRARDVGDRRLRYGVTVPSSPDLDDAARFIDDDVQAPDSRNRRALLADGDELPDDDDEETVVKKGIDRLMEWLLEDAPAAAGVFPILWVPLYLLVDTRHLLDMRRDSRRMREWVGYDSEKLATRIAGGLYGHPSVVSSFGCKARVQHVILKSASEVLREILEQVEAAAPAVLPLPPGQDELTKKLECYLRAAGKPFLILLEDVYRKHKWETIKSALLHAADGCPAGSAIIVTTDNPFIADSSCPRKILRVKNRSFCFKAWGLIGGSTYCSINDVTGVLGQCFPDALAAKLLLHLLYVNPNRTRDELSGFKHILSECKRTNKSVAKQMLKLCYNELPSKYRSCLLYLSIFPKGQIMRRTSLARRWIAEGLIATKTHHIESAMDRSKHLASATDEAERNFDVLVARGFVRPGEISAAGSIKTCTMHHQVHEFITSIATDVNFVDTNLPPDLAHHLSIHNRIRLPASHFDHPLEADGNGIVPDLPYLAKSSQWQLLKVLDLEGCNGLKTKRHLKSICKILLLKYLSLRNTDVTELPKQIEKLQCLETLDIRQTVVRAFATKSVMLPMLKHLLAGQTASPSNSEESFATVRLPRGIRMMKKLEILSHVDVSHNVDDLIDLGQLLKLRKLGVILHRKKGALDLLFQQIEKLCGCLRSLSIRIIPPARSESTLDTEDVAALTSHPKLLQSLNISGITSGLPLWIADLDQLTKITLSETYLGEDAIRILGKLKILSCLRLHPKSYTGTELSFKKEEFRCLKSLVVEGSDITNISFDAGAAPELEMIVWSFATMESLSGANHLSKLKKLELNGDGNPDRVEQLRKAIQKHLNYPDFKHNPHHRRQEDGTVVAASAP